MWKLSVFNFENIPYGNTCIDKLLRNAQASGCILTGQGILNWFPWRKTGLFQNPHQPIQQCGDSDLSDETGELCWPAISGPSTHIMYNVCTKLIVSELYIPTNRNTGFLSHNVFTGLNYCPDILFPVEV